MAMHPVMRVAQTAQHHPPPTGTEWQGYSDREHTGDLLVFKEQDQRGHMLSLEWRQSSMHQATGEHFKSHFCSERESRKTNFETCQGKK